MALPPPPPHRQFGAAQRWCRGEGSGPLIWSPSQAGATAISQGFQAPAKPFATEKLSPGRSLDSAIPT